MFMFRIVIYEGGVFGVDTERHVWVHRPENDTWYAVGSFRFDGNDASLLHILTDSSDHARRQLLAWLPPDTSVPKGAFGMTCNSTPRTVYEFYENLKLPVYNPAGSR